MKNSWKLAAGVAGLLAMPTAALAHAYPASETPPANAVLKSLPTEATITFTETINRHFSGIMVEGPHGRHASDGKATLAPNDPNTLIVHMRRSNRSGRYTVFWHAFASDGHRTHGQYSFDIRP